MECPICSQRLEDAAVSCDGCGFPTALHPESLRAMSEPELSVAVVSPSTRGAAEVRRGSGGAGHERDQTAEACARSARELRGHVLLLQQLGGNAQPFLGEMRQAALLQAEGKSAESLDLLRAPGGGAGRETHELFARRAKELEARAAALSNEGIRPEVQDPLDRLQDALAHDRREEAAHLVIEADRELGTLEQDWRGLRTLLDQINQLQTAAREAGKPIPMVDDDLAQVKVMLARPEIDRELLDTAAQVAARSLMLLHESLPAILEEDLDRHGSALSVYPRDHEPSRRAKVMHSEASRHLRRGRLSEASVRLADLRAAIRELGRGTRTPTPPVMDLSETPPADDTPAEAAAVPTGDPLPRLLIKARTLAARVRALSPDSDLAFEAAGEIRRATELLRARKLDDAETALTRLMRTLDSEPPPEA